MHDSIHNITIHAQKQEDFWYWTRGKDGQFSLKTAWNHIRVKYIEFNWAKIIQHKDCTKKSTCALLAKLNRLNTKERIIRWTNNVDRSCVSYLNQHEDEDHLFFNRAYSNQILNEIMRKTQVNFGNATDINQILEILCQNQNSNQFSIKSIASSLPS